MRPILFVFCLGFSGSLLAGDVQWSGSSDFNPTKENTDFNKTLEFKSLTPDALGGDKDNSAFGKEFSTKSFTLFDKEYNSGKTNIVPKSLDFNKEFPTKDLDFTSQTSPFGDHPLTFKTNQTPWETRKTLVGFDKQIETKEYVGRLADIMKRDMAEVNKKLNPVHDLPDHDLTVDEVRELLNKDHAPSLKSLESGQPGVTPAPQAPLQ